MDVWGRVGKSVENEIVLTAACGLVAVVVVSICAGIAIKSLFDWKK